MARDIDYDNLKDADVHYLRQRNGLVLEAELLGHTDIRKTVDTWKFGEEQVKEEYDHKQDVRVPPQVTGDADKLYTPETHGAADDEEEIEPYSEWSKEELVAELKKRELPASGNKDELVARLEEDDEEEEEDA